MRTKSTTISITRRGARSAARSDGWGPCSVRMLPQLGQEVAELDEQDDADEDADRRDPAVVEHVVGEPGRAERDGDGREQPHGLALREAVVDEAVRGVVLAALGHRAALERRGRP